VLNVMGDPSRECLAALVDTPIRGTRVAHKFGRIAQLCGDPCLVVGDNGKQPASNAMLKWRQDRKLGWHCIAPDKPMQNGLVERVHGWIRAPCPNAHLFPSLRLPVSAPRLLHGYGMARRLHADSRLEELPPREEHQRSEKDQTLIRARL
jgi:putative transposase